MRLLHRLRHDIAQRDIEILAVVLATALLEHWKDGADGLLEHFLFGLHVAAERSEFGDGGALAHSEFAPTAAEQIKHRDALGNPCRMICRELKNAVAEANVAGALAGGGEKRLG